MHCHTCKIRRLRGGLLSIALLSTLALVAVAVSSPGSRGAHFIPAGTDRMTTGSAQALFGTGAVTPIPADFFGPGSDPFVGTVSFTGSPPEPGCDDVDTLIERLDDVNFGSIGETQPVDIEIVSLQLTSVAPITVTYNGGQNPENWHVGMGLVPTGTHTGQLAVTLQNASGGTYTSALQVQPRFTFVRDSDGTALDLDNPLPVSLNAAVPCNWVINHPTTPPLGSEFNAFYPGPCALNAAEMFIAHDIGELLNLPQPNDLCPDALPIVPGLTSFSTLCTGTEGDPAPAGLCNDSGDPQAYNDIYYTFIAPTTSNWFLTTCSDFGASADYDTSLLVFEGCDCGTMQFLACNDDFTGAACADPARQSGLAFPTVAGQCYTICVGGWGPFDEGTGDLLLEDMGGPGPGDGLCQPYIGLNGFFSDLDCDACVTGAASSAEDFHVAAPITIYGVSIRGGFAFGNVLVNLPMDVNIYADAGGAPAAVPLHSFNVLPSYALSGEVLFGLDIYDIDFTLPPTLLGPGDYWIEVVANTTGSPESFFWATGLLDALHGGLGTVFDNFDGSGWHPDVVNGELAVWLDTNPPCPADLNGDGQVNVFDLLDMLTAWGPNPGHPADLNGDGQVNVFDLLQMLTDWGPC